MRGPGLTHYDPTRGLWRCRVGSEDIARPDPDESQTYYVMSRVAALRPDDPTRPRVGPVAVQGRAWKIFRPDPDLTRPDPTRKTLLCGIQGTQLV